MAGLDPKIADTLLDKLSSDDAFRAEFQNDPAAALAGLGHIDSPDAGAACLATRMLASKEAIRDALDELRVQLTSKFTQIPHKLEA